MPGFALTVDYYRIKVRDVISGLTGQAIINRCYDDPTGINNEFCGAISRQTSTTNPTCQLRLRRTVDAHDR